MEDSMAGALPVAEDVIEIIQEIVAIEGIRVLESHGRVQLYSGPDRLVKKAIKAFNNRYKAIEQAKEAKATLIDDTEIGKLMDKYHDDDHIYAYFENLYPAEPFFGNYQADKVMRYASKEFARVCHGKVETAVCGAGMDRIFYEVELPELIKNKNTKSINNIPMQRIKDTYFAQGAYVVYREICKGELEIIRNKAKKECTSKAKEDLTSRLKYHKAGNRNFSSLLRDNIEPAIDRAGPIDTQLETMNPIRQMSAPKGYKAKSIQYG